MKKFILVIFTLIFIIPLAYSQELSEDFLKTLPKEMQADVLNRAAQQGKSADPIYSSIETQTKIEKKELEDLKNRLEEDLEYLKNKLTENEDKLSNKDDLILFGSDFFRTYQSTFMPINEPNLSSEYILDFGDILEIQLTGQQDYTQEFALQRDGSINMPDIGKLQLAGMSLGEASTYQIKGKFFFYRNKCIHKLK